MTLSGKAEVLAIAEGGDVHAQIERAHVAVHREHQRLARAAQQALVGGFVARILQRELGARAPGLAVVLVAELHALDACALDVLVLAFERVEVDDHVVDEVVDVVVERRQRQLLAIA